MSGAVRGLLGRAVWSPADIAEATRLAATRVGPLDPKLEDVFDSPALSEFERKLVEMIRNRFTPAQIADEMETSANSVSSTLSQLRRKYPELDIPKASTGRAADVQQRTEALIMKGLSDATIGDRIGITRDNAAVRRTAFNKLRPVGERYSSRGFKYALPIAGTAGLGLLGRLQMENEGIT